MKHVMGLSPGYAHQLGGSSPGVTVWVCNLRGVNLRGILRAPPLNYEIGDALLMTRSLHHSGDVRSGF